MDVLNVTVGIDPAVLDRDDAIDIISGAIAEEVRAVLAEGLPAGEQPAEGV